MLHDYSKTETKGMHKKSLKHCEEIFYFLNSITQKIIRRKKEILIWNLDMKQKKVLFVFCMSFFSKCTGIQKIILQNAYIKKIQKQY